MSRYEVDVQIDVEGATALQGLGMSEEMVGTNMRLAASTTLSHESGEDPEIELTILLTNDDSLRQLNQHYRGIDKATDVLSFGGKMRLPDGTIYLGDIAISVPQANRQAIQHQQTLMNECVLLAVHGVLHLLGHDHADPEEKARMWDVQATVLRAMDIEPPDLDAEFGS